MQEQQAASVAVMHPSKTAIMQDPLPLVMEVILLKMAGVALIDVADWEMVKEYRWRLGSGGYVATTAKRSDGQWRTLLLHRLILGAKEGEDVDHINRDKQDNRRENLRVVPRWVNVHNRGTTASNTSGFKGVYAAPRNKTNPWMAYIRIEGKLKNLGYYPTAEAAAEVAAAARTTVLETAGFPAHH